MITETEFNKLQELINQRFGEANADYMTFDINAEIDKTLTYEENKRILLEKVADLIGKSFKQRIQEQKAQTEKISEQEKSFIEDERKKYNKEDNIFIEQNNFLIIGKKGSGKTALGWSFLEKIKKESNRKAYIFNHPRTELLKNLPFEVENIPRIEQLYALTDAVVLIDEAHQHFGILEKKINNRLKNLLSISRQNNTCFIFIAHNSYFINRCLFSFIDVRIIKEVNEGHWELERKHMAKLYEDIVIFGKENFYLDCDYIRGQQSFNKPAWFSEDLSCSYRFNSIKKDFFK